MNDKVDSVLRIMGDINECKKSVTSKVGESYDEMSTAQTKMQYTCDTVLRENEILKLRVDTYEREIEDLQQYSRRN